MKTYILAIAGITLITAIVTFIAPSGKTKKLINSVCRLCCVLIIAAPLLSLFNDKIPWNLKDSQTFLLDESYLENSYNRLNMNEEKSLKAYIDSTYSIKSTVKINWKIEEYGYKREKIIVSVQDFGIFPKEEHINILVKIKNDLSKSFSCEIETIEGDSSESLA